VELAGAYAGSRLELDRAVAELGRNRLTLSGTVGSTVDLGITAEFDDLAEIAAVAALDDVQPLHPAFALMTSLTGRADADLSVAGPLSAPRTSGRIEVTESSFDGLPLALSSSFAIPDADAEAVVIDGFEASVGASRLSVAGRVGAAVLASPADWQSTDAPIDLDVDLTLDDLSQVGTLLARDDLSALGPSLGFARSLTGRAAA
jgi:hypothetical protein